MKKLYIVLYAVIIICIAGTAVFLILSPDRVPMHYNFAGEVDRIGSKYENLIFTLFTVGMGAFFALISRHQAKKGKASNEKVMLIVGSCMTIYFTLMGFFFMWNDVKYDPNAARTVSGNDVLHFVGVGMGALFLALGNIMPKVRRNSIFGLRTEWSMANDAVWQKSQRFGGFAFVISGLCMIVLSLIVPARFTPIMLIAVALICAVVCVAASYRYYMRDFNSHGGNMN